jgi:hypothetical protein
VGLDAPLRKVASTVLAKFGTSAVLRRVTGTGYNTTTGTMSPTTTDTAVKGRLDDYLDRELSDTIKAGDRKLTIAAADVPARPTVSDTVLYGGLVYQIVRVESVIAKDASALYVLQVRR